MGVFTILSSFVPPAYAQGDTATLSDLEGIFGQVVSAATTLAGLALLAMLIVGGFKYMTAGGDPKASAAAKNTITYALLGMALVVAAYLILLFVERFTGVPVTIFKITR